MAFWEQTKAGQKIATRLDALVVLSCTWLKNEISISCISSRQGNHYQMVERLSTVFHHSRNISCNGWWYQKELFLTTAFLWCTKTYEWDNLKEVLVIEPDQWHCSRYLGWSRGYYSSNLCPTEGLACEIKKEGQQHQLVYFYSIFNATDQYTMLKIIIKSIDPMNVHLSKDLLREFQSNSSSARIFGLWAVLTLMTDVAFFFDLYFLTDKSIPYSRIPTRNGISTPNNQTSIKLNPLFVGALTEL